MLMLHRSWNGYISIPFVTIKHFYMKKMPFPMTIILCLLLTACTKNDRQSSGTASQQGIAQQTPSLVRLSTAGTALTTPFTTAYVEVNSNSFHNPGCFTYGSPAKQVFGFAVIFAANINDSSNGQAELYFN